MERRRAVGLGALVLLLVGMPFAYLGGGEDENGDALSLAIVLAFCIVLLVVLIELGVPRFVSEEGAGTLARNALIFSAVALVLCVVFWTGLPIVIGAVGVVLGLAARDRARPGDQGKATAAIAIGAFAAIASFVVLLVG